jgi:hypothetical protein
MRLGGYEPAFISPVEFGTAIGAGGDFTGTTRRRPVISSNSRLAVVYLMPFSSAKLRTDVLKALLVVTKCPDLR